jgi:hypothetical protein
VGAARTVHLKGGQLVKERLESLDSKNHSYSYSMLPPAVIPVDDYLATVNVVALGSRKTRIDYRSTGRSRGEPLGPIRPILTTLYETIIDGARRLSVAT